MQRLSYKLLLLLTIVATAGGILTLMPRSAASYPNLIGYSSLCTYAPAATFFCFFIAGFTCFIRSTFIKDQSGSNRDRFKRHAKRLIPLGIVLVAALMFHFRYSNIKARYTDGGTSASVSEQEEQYE